MKDEVQLLEIIELPDGDIALMRADSDEMPLVKIRFSEDSLHLLGKMKLAVASAMIGAGMHAFEELSTAPDQETVPEMLH